MEVRLATKWTLAITANSPARQYSSLSPNLGGPRINKPIATRLLSCRITALSVEVLFCDAVTQNRIGLRKRRSDDAFIPKGMHKHWAEVTPWPSCGLHSENPIATPVDHDHFLHRPHPEPCGIEFRESFCLSSLSLCVC